MLDLPRLCPSKRGPVSLQKRVSVPPKEGQRPSKRGSASLQKRVSVPPKEGQCPSKRGSASLQKRVTQIIKEDGLATMVLEQQGLTAFLPNNEAFSNYSGPRDRTFIYAHLSNTPLQVEELGDTVTTNVMGNPDLYITKLANGKPGITGWEDHDYYVNNAKIVVANQRAESGDGHEQVPSGVLGELWGPGGAVLHIIDEVLPPTRVQGRADVDVKGYPSAADVLLNFRAYGLTNDLSVELFQDRVSELQLTEVYRTPGQNTFFVPLDRGISDSSEVLDVQVVHGHVVPGHALFTRPTARHVREIESLAFTDNLKVLLKVEEVSSRPPSVYYVTSNTVASDQKHQLGTAVAQIRRANIALSNGVMHLIDRRLMTKAESILSYLKKGHTLTSLPPPPPPPEYHVEWTGIGARVVQGDVECVNGVLHIIDKRPPSCLQRRCCGKQTAAILFTAAAILDCDVRGHVWWPCSGLTSIRDHHPASESLAAMLCRGRHRWVTDHALVPVFISITRSSSTFCALETFSSDEKHFAAFLSLLHVSTSSTGSCITTACITTTVHHSCVHHDYRASRLSCITTTVHHDCVHHDCVHHDYRASRLPCITIACITTACITIACITTTVHHDCVHHDCVHHDYRASRLPCITTTVHHDCVHHGYRAEWELENGFCPLDAAVLHQLFCTSCSASAVLDQLFCTSCSASAVLDQLFCTSCSAPAVLHQLFWTSYSASAVLHQLFCTSCSAPAVYRRVSTPL
ncbi:FAS1 domain [Trinorchestia longiramus]|nr:FAS1 domain [Trinorchestia longiramus]